MFDKLLLTDNGRDDCDFSKKPTLLSYFSYLENTLLIRKAYYISEGKIQLRNLNGNEKLKLFSQINLVKVVPRLENVDLVQKLWSDFYNIYVSVKDLAYPENCRCSLIKNHTSNWLNLFKSLYHETHITPYIHIFTQHLYYFVYHHEDISLYTMQGN